MTPIPNNPQNIHGVVSYKRAFNDLNKEHLKAAKSIGIAPLHSQEEAEELGRKVRLISDGESYCVDSLTHSIPYLIPGTAKLLEDIGSSFLDSLENKGLNAYKIIVTSATRTKEDVKKLRKKNTNATENSAHYYGTTFDISWKRFKKVEHKSGRPTEDVGSDTLKMVLSEVLRDMRKSNRCFIKYELKQGCFHITGREK